jgi:hypothetical protein
MLTRLSRPASPPSPHPAPRCRIAIPRARATVLATGLILAALAAGVPATRAVARATPAAPACIPTKLEPSAALAHGAITVSPAPDTRDASHLTQISFLGAPAPDIINVIVIGSRSGPHLGRMLAYSQGDGVSFLPHKPFTEGELVTVHAVLRQGATTTPFAWHFTVADVDYVSHSLETPPSAPSPPKANEFQRFVSRPDLRPPSVAVTTNTGSQAPGDLFLAPYAGPGQYGPMILDGNGRLIWFKALPAGARAADLRVQQYEGQPVLTWWQDPLAAAGRHDAGVVIADSSYRDIAIVRGGNGYQPDLHAFEITPQGTALFTVYDAIRCNLSPYEGPADGALADTLVQEIDLHTGLVRYEWHSLDHVPLTDSYMPVGHNGTPVSPWDWFHINAVSQQNPTDPTLLVDSRNTWAAYQIELHTGHIAWTLGGKHSSFAMGAGASPAWQHDVRQDPSGTISFFDNGATPKIHTQSRVLVLALDQQHHIATLLWSFNHPTPLISPSQGDFQPLPDGGWFVGWGQDPYFSELSPTGALLFDGHLPATYQSYTVLEFPWTGTPPQPPRLAVRPHSHGLLAYASWNGATAVAQWRLLGGPTAHALTPLATVPREGFETTIPLSSAPPYLAVQALDAHGQVLSTSATAHP